MNISDIINVERIACHAEAGSKKRVLELMSELLVKNQNDLPANEVFDSLFERERLGSTGLGHGIAIPHGRISHGTQPVGAFAQISKAVDFDAPDEQPVDLVFGLVVPEESTTEHLEILAELASILDDDQVCERLRKCESQSELMSILATKSTRPGVTASQ